jgi:DNA mismatch repair protein MutL
VTVVDLQAAAELLARRGLEQALAAGKPASRPLLLPVAVPVGRREAQAAEDLRELCLALGLDLTRSGPESVVVRRVPAALHDVDPALLSRAALATLTQGGESPPSAERMAGALARTAGAAIAAQAAGEQIEALLRALEAIPASERPAGLARELTHDDLVRLLAAGPGVRGS